VLREPGCDPGLLDHFVRTGQFHGEDLASIIAHPAIGDATLEALAAGTDAETLMLIVTNEVRIINNPRLFSAMRANAALPADGRRRLAGWSATSSAGSIRLRRRRGTPPAAEAPAAEAVAGTAASRSRTEAQAAAGDRQRTAGGGAARRTPFSAS
jgi:hypothetical protein